MNQVDLFASAARAAGRPKIYLINHEEESRTRELIHLQTWPQGWDGDEPTADTVMDIVYQNGAVQPRLFIGAEQDRPIRANREKSCLSAAFTWMIRQPDSGVKVNPCKGVKRNPESKRDRYVEDAEYNAVYKVAEKSVKALMDLIYRTLQRPEDIITWTSKNIIKSRRKSMSF